jgi:hypothetical protein
LEQWSLQRKFDLASVTSYIYNKVK